MAEHRPVTVVTDSTSDLPLALREQYGIVVAPLTVTVGNTSYIDGVELSGAEFFRQLAHESDLPKTSQPSIPTFEAVFREALDAGQDVVCITVASQLSGTFNSARLAAESVDASRIRVVDSGTTTMGLGWITVAAARAAAAGADLEAVVTEATSAIQRTDLFALLQTLDYVFKGGRIGRASHLVGSALGIKPIISIDHGVVTPLERVRTWKKALNRLPELVTRAPSDVWIGHAENVADANRLRDEMLQRYPSANVVLDYCGSTIGVYAGPGAVAIAALYPSA